MNSKSSESYYGSDDHHQHDIDWGGYTEIDHVVAPTHSEQDLYECKVDEYQLPEGWSCEYDEQYQSYYYFDLASGHSQWEFPQYSNADEKDFAQITNADEDIASHKQVDVRTNGYQNDFVDFSSNSKESEVHSLSSSQYSMKGYDLKPFDSISVSPKRKKKPLQQFPSSVVTDHSYTISDCGYHGPAEDFDLSKLDAVSTSKLSPLFRAARRRGYKFPFSSCTKESADQHLSASHDSAYDDQQDSAEVVWYGPEDNYLEEDVFDGQEVQGFDSLNIAEGNRDHSHLQVPEKFEDDITSGDVQPKKEKLLAMRSGTTQHDYSNMARLYRIQRPYSDPNFAALCLLCHKNYAEDVFFPCEHHCICRKCIYNEKICEEKMLGKISDAYINCSLCAGIIKRILPLDGGREVATYWNWVLEEKPELPREFLRNFKHSAGVIDAVYVSDEFKRAHGYPVDEDKRRCLLS